MKKDDVVIIGAGPAGISAAIQLNRYNINPIIFEKNDIGGLLRNANLVENYLGFPYGISGEKLVKLFKKQLHKASIDIINEEVISLDLSNGSLKVKSANHLISSTIVIVATGTKPKILPKNIFKDEFKNSIFYDIQPIKNVKDKKITIIGSGDIAFDYAINLSKKNFINILNRSKKSKCLPILNERCRKEDRIIYKNNITPIKIQKTDKQKELICINTQTKENIKIISDYIIGAIGREPLLDFISPHVNKKKNVLINEKKLYIIGDAHNGILRQTGISIGDGIKTAMQIHRYINRSKI